MHNYNLKIATYFLVLVAAIATTILGVKSMSYPITFTVLGFIAWAASPYVYLTAMAKLVSTQAAVSAVFLFSLLAGLFGIWLIVDAMFIHPDAQGGLIYIFVPAWQWAFLVLATVPLYFLNRVKNS